MNAEYIYGTVRSPCPGCNGALSTFLYKEGGQAFGSIIANRSHTTQTGHEYSRAIYQLMQCGGCGRGALATIYCGGQVKNGKLVDFYPFARAWANLPTDTPDDIAQEFREAELCAAVDANRAASVMFRSALEKTLTANGYKSGNLKSRINDAAKDGLITESRKSRAHEDIRSLGNDVLHEPWRPVDDVSVEVAHKFTQRVIEDFYDDRATAKKLLQDKGKLPPDNLGNEGAAS